MREILLYLVVKYNGDWFKAYDAIKRKEKPDLEEAQKLEEKYSNTYITILDEEYPEYLRQASYPPLVLFYKGNIELLKKSKRISVVGSRKSSNYGELMTKELVEGLVDRKYIIVSGLAKGIDSVAHNTCLKKNGQTIAVVANGLDVSYPLSNDDMYKEIAEKGLLLSEYPFGVEPETKYFNMRNRIIAAIGESLLVTEAYDRSGTLLTIKHALFMGKEIFTIPYRITDNSQCNKLIEEGATMVCDVEDLLEKI